MSDPQHMPDDRPLDPRVEAALQWMEKHPYGDQTAEGVDRSLIRAFLTLTPTERLLRNDAAARLVRARMRIQP